MPRQVTRRSLLAVSVAATAFSVAACSDPPLILHNSPTPPSTSPGVPPSVDYLVVAPRTFRAGQPALITCSQFQDGQPATGPVTVSLLQNGQPVGAMTANVTGRATVSFNIPRLVDGQYQLQVSGRGFQDQAPIQVTSSPLPFLETDKPVYQPGQTVHFRVLTLDPSFRPVATAATLEVADAKGLKILRKTVAVDDLGMASVDLPLSTEPNLGVWKATLTAGQQSSQLDLRVERYVLPKYEVKINLSREWALASDPIKGTVGAEYSFGKPVQGELEIQAQRYLGTWQEYARVSKTINGTTSFEIPAVGYAVGSPAVQGLAQVRLDIVVREAATGDEEHNSQLVTIATRPIHLQFVPESGAFKPGLPFGMLVVSESPDHSPVDLTVNVRVTYQDRRFRTLKTDTARLATQKGLATLRVTPPADATQLVAEATAANADAVPLTLQAGYSPTGSFIHLEPLSTGPFKVGDTAHFHVHATREAENFYYELLARGSVVYSNSSPSADLAIPVTPTLAPEARLLVYQILTSGEVVADFLPFKVEGSYPHQVSLKPGSAEAKPGDLLDVTIQTEGPARVGLTAVDRSVFIL
ncbi:MAG TPA: MG2 domain-containing protein, partial [Chloroflexota bacterium]|nr:MG2 domain-containing protein [Chloroflexota bacterium]